MLEGSYLTEEENRLKGPNLGSGSGGGGGVNRQNTCQILVAFTVAVSNIRTSVKCYSEVSSLWFSTPPTGINNLYASTILEVPSEVIKRKE